MNNPKVNYIYKEDEKPEPGPGAKPQLFFDDKRAEAIEQLKAAFGMAFDAMMDAATNIPDFSTIEASLGEQFTVTPSGSHTCQIKISLVMDPRLWVEPGKIEVRKMLPKPEAQA